MSDEKEKLGFSGLSSLASDIEEVAADTPRPKDQSERSATPAYESFDAKGFLLGAVEFFLDLLAPFSRVVAYFLDRVALIFSGLFVFFLGLVVLGVLILLFENGYWFVGLVMFGALIWLFKEIFKDR